MNEFPYGKLPDEVYSNPEDPESELGAVSKYLGKPYLKAGTQYAQSIVTRSESELFGNSIPRFAIRLHFEKDHGFINCRRLKTFKTHAVPPAVAWGQRQSDTELSPFYPNQELSEPPSSLDRQELLDNDLVLASPIADGLLSPPSNEFFLPYKFNISHQANLRKAYGEIAASASASDRILIPYVKSFSLGGGLCAQSVAFIATALLSKYARHLCGLGEITAFAHEDWLGELPLTALGIRDLARYFNATGLKHIEQGPEPTISSNISSPSILRLGQALRSYLCSGIPILVPVELQRLSSFPNSNTSIYGSTGYHAPDDQSLNAFHYIILIGYAEDGRRFVCHDPASLPFLRANINQILGCGVERLILSGTEKVKQRDCGAFASITPTEVQMPLMNARLPIPAERGSYESRAGLFEFSDLAHREYKHFPSAQWKITRRFVLKQVKEDPQLPLQRSDLHEIPDEEKHLFLSKISELKDRLASSYGPNHWYWFEVLPNSIWIWNAEMEPPQERPTEVGDLTDYLMGVVIRDGQEIELFPLFS